MQLKFFVFLLLLSPCQVFSQTVDSPEKAIDLTRFEFTDQASVATYLDLFKKYEDSFSSEQELLLIDKGLDASTELGNDSVFIQFTVEKADIFIYQLREFENAIEELLAIRMQVDASPSMEVKGQYFRLLGLAYHGKGNSSKALENYLESYNCFKVSGNSYDLSVNLFNISLIYEMVGDEENSLKYAREMLQESKTLNSEKGLVVEMKSYNLLSGLFSAREMRDSSLYYTEQALETVLKIDTAHNPNLLTTCCSIYLGGILNYSKKGDTAKADALLEKAKPCEERMKHKYTRVFLEYSLAKKDYETTGRLLKDFYNTQKGAREKLNTANLSSRYHEAIGDYKTALIEERKASEFKKELTKQKRMQMAAFANTQYETVKKEEEIKALKQSEAFEQQRSRLLFIVIFFLFLLLVLGLFAYRKIRNQATELQHTYKQRSKLFTNIAHELRTPLTLISGPIRQLIRSTDLEDGNKELLNLVKKSSEDLKSVSQQIMDLNKSDHGKINSNSVRFDWSEFLQHYLPEYKTQALTKGLRFEQTIPDKGFWVQSDLEKLKVILNNLFQNAFKFSTENGKIIFKSTVEQNQISFSVQDTGIGIAKDSLPHVFKRYYQSNHNLGGFGVGLAICKEYTETLGGKITLHSEQGKGTRVKVNIPRAERVNSDILTKTFAPKTMTTQHSEAVQTKDEYATKLLIIEDHEGISSLLKTTLSTDYELHFAKNGKEGLQILDNLQPDLIITDWMMPVMNGLQFVEEIRKHESRYNLPVLMLTARSFPVDKLKALRKGVDDYLVKPFDVEVLKVRIENLLHQSNDRRDALETNPQSLDFISQNQKDYEWILDVENIIYNHIHKFDLNIGLLAEKSNLSKSHFSKKLKVITGMPPTQFINEVKFWEARKMLEEKQETSVKAVAYSVGLKSVKNFSRNFKKRFGVYPKELLN